MCYGKYHHRPIFKRPCKRDPCCPMQPMPEPIRDPDSCCKQCTKLFCRACPPDKTGNALGPAPSTSFITWHRNYCPWQTGRKTRISPIPYWIPARTKSGTRKRSATTRNPAPSRTRHTTPRNNPRAHPGIILILPRKDRPSTPTMAPTRTVRCRERLPKKANDRDSEFSRQVRTGRSIFRKGNPPPPRFISLTGTRLPVVV